MVEKTVNDVKEATRKRNTNDVYMILSLFLAGACIFVILYCRFPTNEDIEFPWKFPRSLQDIRDLAHVSQNYYERNPTYVTVLIAYLFVFLQSFGAPGPSILGMLCGVLFGPIRGFFIAVICACTGACLCYGLSDVIGKSIVMRYFPGLIRKFDHFIGKHRHNLFWYLLFLRIVPILPNRFLNYASPIVGIPFKLFAASVWLGFLPNIFLLVRTGLLLHEITEFGISNEILVVFLGLGALALIPAFLSNRQKKTIEELDGEPQKTE